MKDEPLAAVLLLYMSEMLPVCSVRYEYPITLAEQQEPGTGTASFGIKLKKQFPIVVFSCCCFYTITGSCMTLCDACMHTCRARETLTLSEAL